MILDMNSRSLKIIVAFVILFCATNNAQAASLNIIQIYKKIPARYFVHGTVVADPYARITFLKKEKYPPNTLDTANYYLSVSMEDEADDTFSSDAEKGHEVALFINGTTPTIAVSSFDCGLWCPPLKQKIVFLQPEGAEWKDVTLKILKTSEKNNMMNTCIVDYKKQQQELSSATRAGALYHCKRYLRYRLPQHGTTIHVFNQDTPFYKFEWSNGSFHGSEWSNPN